MTQKIRRLTNSGMKEFQRYLVELRSNRATAPPFSILNEDGNSEELFGNIDIEQAIFESRFDMGVYLSEKLQHLDPHVISHDAGLWSWLALYFFDQLCPIGKNGERVPRETYSYILSRDYRHHSRHAIRTTWHFVRLYGSTVRFMFSKPLHERGEILEQLSARQELAASPAIIVAASLLYDDPVRGTFKRGAAGRKGGSIWRFVGLLQQLRLTYDLHDIGADDLVKLLPAEFDRYRPKAAQ